MRYDWNRESGQEYADLKFNCTFLGDCNDWLIDVTTSGTHSASNLKYTVLNDGHSSGLADHAEHLKNLKHDRYITNGKAIGFAMDSMGGISKGTAKFINYIYAARRNNRPRRWDSEKMRCVLKKNFLDTLSCIQIKHRVLHYTKMGLPNAIRGGDIQEPHNNHGRA